MFRLSRAAEYAIRGILYLSDAPEGDPIDVAKIAAAQKVPPAYLAKLFQTLTKKGVIRSVRGPEGGFMLLKRPDTISVLDIIEAVEGPIFMNDCLISDGQCSMDKTCPVHDMWGDAQRKFLDHLKKSTFDNLVKAGKAKVARLEAGVQKIPEIA